MKRMVELDVLRGFLLLMMVVNHSPSPLRQLTDQPIGFFSTAEAFVFISALLAGLIFQKRREKLGFAAARAATLLDHSICGVCRGEPFFGLGAGHSLYP
jgi:hypothetical protein